MTIHRSDHGRPKATRPKVWWPQDRRPQDRQAKPWRSPWFLTPIFFLPFVLGLAGTAIALRTARTAPPETLASPATATLIPRAGQTRRTPAPPTPATYSAEAIDDFFAVAFGGEFADYPDAHYLRRWVGPIRLQVFGKPTAADRQTLDRIVGELNQLLRQSQGEATPIQIQILADGSPDGQANAKMYFVPRSEFRRVEPNYVEGNMGFFYVWWNSRLEMERSRILISTTGVDQTARSHLIREELTQSLGLMNDSWRDPESTFYQGWTLTQDFTDRDREAIRLLYDPRFHPGMSQEAVAAKLRGGG